MHFFALNLILGIVWWFLTGSFSTANLIFGLLIGFGVLAVSQPFLGSAGYVRSVIQFLRFMGIYLKEIAVANVQLARDLLRRDMPFVPGFIRFDTEGKLSHGELAVLANMISLTPGTLSMDTDEAGHVLYIHSVYASDPDALREGFRYFMELIDRVQNPEAYPREVKT